MLRVGELEGVDADDAGLAAGLDDGADGRGRDDVVLCVLLFSWQWRGRMERRKSEKRREKGVSEFFPPF